MSIYLCCDLVFMNTVSLPSFASLVGMMRILRSTSQLSTERVDFGPVVFSESCSDSVPISVAAALLGRGHLIAA